MHTGIVIVSYNAVEATCLTLDSLAMAKGNAPFSVAIIDNASEPERAAAIREHFLAQVNAGKLSGAFFEMKENLGFSGGNNVGINHFLKNPEVTHICLLNSDVIVTDWWLDRLLAWAADAIGPMSNAVGNEQTLPIDYVSAMDSGAFDLANKFAQNWYRLWKGNSSETNFLGFFAALFSRKLIEKIGLLDTRFYPGSYEDDDYCVRILDSGFHMKIARDVFVHHWGSASFSQLPMQRRLDTGAVNRKRFEEKWARTWEDRSHTAVTACQLETLHALRHGLLTKEHLECLSRYFDGLSNLVRATVEHNKHLEAKINEVVNTRK